MKYEHRIKEQEERKQEIIRFTTGLDEKLRTNQLNLIEYQILMNEQYPEKTKEELINEIHEETRKLKNHAKKQRKTKIQLSIAGAILIILAVISLFSQYIPEIPAGFVVSTKQITQTTDYNRVFDHYTETQLNITNITSLRISGELQGTKATIKLRINNVDYIVVDIINEQEEQSLITGLAITEQEGYTLSTDKTSYTIGETVYIIIEPETENKSLYINYRNGTHKLEGNNYTTKNIGEHQVIALIVLPNDILRLETNFTVINTTETNVSEHSAELNETINITINETVNATTNETTNQTNIYKFENLCTETCNILETSYPILIIEPQENSTLTITKITVIQNKENQAPLQTKQIPDININTEQTVTLNLNDYFSDPDNDTTHYDINEIPEINAEITQNTLTINSNQPGIYIAYIYATDGDKLTTSNTFQITITQTNETINITTPTNITPTETIELCAHPDINQRPSYCFLGIEDKVFKDLSAPIENRKGGLVGRFTRFGNLIIKGLVIQNATGTPEADDFKIGFSETIDFEEIRTYTVWIEDETGNLYLRGRVYEEQDILVPPQFNTYIIQNKFGIVLGYFDELRGDLYIKGNLVQLGKI